MRLVTSLLASTILFPSLVVADTPRIATDIAPVHSLVSMVLGDLGEADLIVRPGASPHGYALRPSEARALQDADVVFWIGHDLTPWLEDPIETLASDARVQELSDIEGTLRREFRDGIIFEPDHDDHNEHAEGEHHDEHAETEHHDDHAEGEHHDDHAEAEHDDHHHHTDGLDPHLWLDPVNAITWLPVIAETIAGIDPDNADTYRANATASQARIETLVEQVEIQLADAPEGGFIVFHDAYAYFETRFDRPASAALSQSDASTPSAGRLAEIQEHFEHNNVHCVFSEPQYSEDLVTSLVASTGVQHGVIDPLGSTLTPGADLYVNLIEGIATTMADCLSASS